MSTAPDLMQEEARRLAREVAELSGETEAQAVVVSLRERLRRLAERRHRRDEFQALRRQWQEHPKVDGAATQESLYDENGLPT